MKQLSLNFTLVQTGVVCITICLALAIFTSTQLRNANAAEFTFESLIKSPGKIRALLESGQLYQVDVPNPHWQQDGCIACHSSQTNPSRSNVRSWEDRELCENCHNEYTKAAFIHPTGAMLPKDMWREMPAVYRKSLLTIGNKISKKLTCLSCHDLKIQCLDTEFSQRSLNSRFFRLGPFQNRVELCFYCHESRYYKRFTPHKQIEGGQLDKNKCKICHLNEDKLTSTSDTKDIKLHHPEDLNKLCVNCHPWKPHPGWEFAIRKKKDANHLVKPSNEIFQRMQISKTQVGIDLPLEPETGEIYCATCHNPHEKGVIKSSKANSGADSERRMRLKEACSYCHDY